MVTAEMRQEALSHAVNGLPNANYVAIISEFSGRGIPEDEIRPRENVFTFQAWRALGRTVKRGEHGVKVLTYIPMSKVVRDVATGEDKVESWKRPWTATVFHVSQTEPWTHHKDH